MRTSLRLALLACAGLVALAVANAAWAAYTPRLIIGGTTHALRVENSVVISVSQDENDDPTAKIDITVPEGYVENFTAAPGTEIGIVEATLKLHELGGVKVDVSGQVRADNPANHTSNACAPGLHTAVWLLQVTLQGQAITVPIYVDDVPNVPTRSARIQLCLAGPIGTPRGAQLLSASFLVRDVFTNPSTAAVYTWSAFFTPYNPGTPTPNPPGTVESRAVVPIPIRVRVLRARKSGRNVTITGAVTIPGDLVPASVQIWAGTSSRRLRRSGSARVAGAGRFTARRRAPRRARFAFYQARIDLPPVDITAQACATPSLAPRGCVTGTMTPVTLRSNTVRVRLRRR
jgi:hypothetical protein